MIWESMLGCNQYETIVFNPDGTWEFFKFESSASNLSITHPLISVKEIWGDKYLKWAAFNVFMTDFLNNLEKEVNEIGKVFEVDQGTDNNGK